MSEFFDHTLTGSISHIFRIFLKSRENHKTNSKKLRQNFSLTKELFLENKSRNEPFLLALSVKSLYSLKAYHRVKVLI